MSYFIAIIVLLGGLIFIHELGHFLVAKYFNIKVEVFSLGFGPKIFKRKWGETEYCLSLIPLGGYVKMLGDDPKSELSDEEKARAFLTQPPKKRFLVVLAGPVFNLVLAVFLFMAVNAIGERVPKSVYGNIVFDSNAWHAGLRSGDEVLKINGKAVNTFRQMEKQIQALPDGSVKLDISRNGKNLTIIAPVTRGNTLSIYGQQKVIGKIQGALMSPVSTKIGISNPASLAWKAGLRSGDVIKSINGYKVVNMTQVLSYLDTHNDTKLDMVVNRTKNPAPKPDDEGEKETLTVTLQTGSLKGYKASKNKLDVLGIHNFDTFIVSVVENSPAEKIDIQPGDRVYSVAGKRLYSGLLLNDSIQKNARATGKFSITIERNGQLIKKTVEPQHKTLKDPVSQIEQQKFLIGINYYIYGAPPAIMVLRNLNPIYLTGKSVVDTYNWTKIALVSLYKLVSGQVSPRALGGPILIGKLAGDSLKVGFVPFLKIMAIISINLFLLNLLPIPILDGGHLLFYMIEIIRRKPLATRKMEIATQIGFVFIIMLIIFVTFNDALRFFVKDVGQVFK